MASSGVLLQPGLVVAHRRRQQPHDVPVALRLAERRDGRCVVLQVAVAVGLVQVGLFELARGRQHDVGVVGRVGHEQLVDDGEEVVALQPFDDQAGVGRGGDRVGAEDEERFDRRVVDLAGQRRAEAVHVDRTRGSAGIRLAWPTASRVPAHIAAGAVGQPAAAHAVLAGHGRQAGSARTVWPPLPWRWMPSANLSSAGLVVA